MDDLVGDAQSVVDHAKEEMQNRLNEYYSAKSAAEDFVFEVNFEAGALDARLEEMEDILESIGVEASSLAGYVYVKEIIDELYVITDDASNEVEN